MLIILSWYDWNPWCFHPNFKSLFNKYWSFWVRKFPLKRSIEAGALCPPIIPPTLFINSLLSLHNFLQVHAQSGNCTETQHRSTSPLYPRPQRQNLPLPGDERRLPDGVAPGGEGPAAAAPPQPLSGEEEGDHQKAPLLHWYDYR